MNPENPVQCTVCHRPLLEGVGSCVVCGAPVTAPPVPRYDAYAPGPPPPLPYAAPPQGYYPMQPSPGWGAQRFVPQDNTFATVSLVCGLLGLVPFWIGFILCVIAIAFGIAGLHRSSQLPNYRGRGLALAGLILGLIFILPASCGL